MVERKPVIKNADMSEEMQQDALDCATAALEKFNIEKVSVCLDSTARTINLCLAIEIVAYYFIFRRMNNNRRRIPRYFRMNFLIPRELSVYD